MGKHLVQDIRNVALVGHAAAGKTSLADALLFKAKAVDRHGRVDDGTSFSDYDEEEKQHKYSIDTSVLHLEYDGKYVYLLDTPGKPDFIGAALGALAAADTALLVISASHGLQVNTRRMFNEAGRRGMGRIIALNHLDGDNIEFDSLLAQIEETFGKSCVLFNAPVGLGPDFKDVVSVLDPPENIPDGTLVDVEAARAKLVDAIVESDETLMDKYLEQGTLTNEDLHKALPSALAAGSLVPVFCTSATKEIGVQHLLEEICELALSPLEAAPRKALQGNGEAAKEVELTADESAEFVAQVFKNLNDKFIGTLSFLRVLSGKVSPEQPFVNLRSGKHGRLHGLLLIQGKDQKAVDEAVPGDIIAVAKIDDLHIGDSIAAKDDAPVVPAPDFPTPMFGLAVEPKSRGDEQKISSSLQKTADEDPTFRISRDDQTKELVMTGMSQLHLEVVQQRLKRRYALEMVTHQPKIPYRETITSDGEASHRHKKQSGGRGQFGEVHLRVYPLSRDISTEEELLERFATKERFEKMRSAHYDPEFNFAFIDTIVGGSIPNQFVPAVEKGCRELLVRGALAGFRMEDVAVEVYFGKDHPVDSSETAFKVAGRLAMKAAVLQANPVVLEPIVDMEVTVPSSYVGTILGDLNTKRARIEDQESLPGDLTLVKGKIPLAEVTRYKAALDSITHGTGSYSMEFSHYDVVPGNIQKQIVEKAQIAEDEDE